jgi:hypothetical protein
VFAEGTNVTKCLNPAARKVYRALTTEVRDVIGLVASFCRYVNLKLIREERKDDPTFDVNNVAVEAGSGCHFTEDQIRWAFIVARQRLHRASNRFSPAILPFVDAMSYATRPTVQPGMVLYAGEDGQIDRAKGNAAPLEKTDMAAALEVIASRNLKASDALTFRTAYLEPETAALVFGLHTDENFANGATAWVAWDTASDETLRKLNCSTHLDANRIRADGSVADLMIACAELHVIKGETEETASAEPTTAQLRSKHVDGSYPDVTLGAYDFLTSHADLALSRIPSATAASCPLKPSPLRDTITALNERTRQLFDMFKLRIAHRRKSKVAVKEAVDVMLQKQAERKRAADDTGSLEDDVSESEAAPEHIEL